MSSGYSTFQNTKPAAGAFWPAARLSHAASTSPTHAGDLLPRPTSTSVPTIVRTMECRKALPTTRMVTTSVPAITSGYTRKLHNVTMRWFANRRSRHTKTLEIMLANEVRTGLVHRIDIKRRATQMPRDRRNEYRTGRVRANVIVVFAPQRVKSSGKTERAFIDRRNRNRFIDQGIKRTLQPTERSRLELIFRHVKTYDLPSSMHARVGSSRANDGNVALIEHRENRTRAPLAQS